MKSIKEISFETRGRKAFEKADKVFVPLKRKRNPNVKFVMAVKL